MHQQSLFYPLHRLEKWAFPAIKASLTYVFFDCSRLYSPLQNICNRSTHAARAASSRAVKLAVAVAT